MFVLQEREVSGYRFSEPTFYSDHHLGVDYKADYVPLVAPFDGTITEAFEGIEGGKTLWFRPDHDDVTMRFLHLDYFPVKKGERVKQGQQIAITGNTGKLTKGPHLHVDISQNPFILAWPGHFIDPETYNWDWQPENAPEPTPVPIAFWVSLLYRANFRSDPTTNSKVMVTYATGTQVECIETVEGQEVTVGGVTSNKWYKSRKSGWYVSAAVSTHL